MYVLRKKARKKNGLLRSGFRSFSGNQWVLIWFTYLGDRTDFVIWTTAETEISIISIYLPNIVQLLRRAHQHGMIALFTRQEFNEPVKSGRPLKIGMANPAFVPGTKEGFWRIIGKSDSRSSNNVHRLIDNDISTEAVGLQRVSASAQWQHAEERDLYCSGSGTSRQDVSVREEGERWNGVRCND